MTSTQTATITLQHGVGYRGKLGEPATVNRLTGISEKRYVRVELNADSIERDNFTGPRYVRTLTYYVGPGLYELISEGETAYRMVWMAGDVAQKTAVDKLRITAILRLMDAGQDFEAARLATKPVAA